MTAWLDMVAADPVLDANARRLAQVLVEDFSVSAPNYVAAYDRDLAEVLGKSISAIVAARRALVNGGHLIPLQYGHGAPSFKLSSSRW